MSTTKRCISLLLVLCLLLSVVPVTAHAVTASGTCGDYLTWTLNDDGVLTISGTGPMTDYTNSYALPWDSNRNSIFSVIIENGITTIGDLAFFGCVNLSSVTTIGNLAFAHCSSMSGIYVDANNLSYSNDDRGVLFDKHKTYLMQTPGAIGGSYSIPNSVTAISDYAFSHCDSLGSVVITGSVTTIGDSPFLFCDSLSGIWVILSEKGLGNYALTLNAYL